MKSEGELTATRPETESFLDEALKLAREVLALRGRLVVARRDHAERLAEREEKLREGIDVLPEIRQLFLEAEELPVKITQLEQRVHWLVDQGVTKLNAESSQTAARQYVKSRDSLRQALESFREEFVVVQANIQSGEDLGPSLTDVHNSKLAEIENILGGVHFARVTYRLLPLPPLDHELVRQNQVLAAIDRLIGGLH